VEAGPPRKRYPIDPLGEACDARGGEGGRGKHQMQYDLTPDPAHSHGRRQVGCQSHVAAETHGA
jgi:hypothetical protein